MESTDSNLASVMTEAGNEADCKKDIDITINDRNVECPVCHKLFKFDFSSSKIWGHLSNNHQIEEYNFLCYVCAQKFSDHKLLKTHLKTHENGVTYKCLICKKACATEVELKAHTIQHHRNYKQRFVDCHLCRRYINCKHFQNHLQKHADKGKTECQLSPSHGKRKESSEEREPKKNSISEERKLEKNPLVGADAPYRPHTMSAVKPGGVITVWEYNLLVRLEWIFSLPEVKNNN